MRPDLLQMVGITRFLVVDNSPSRGGIQATVSRSQRGDRAAT